ncbi:MAG: MoaD/ThiS family protein [Bacteroidetes bacterium]|nr:MoaD/ThiS family protein [Bacteroidota bacterium]
MSLKILFFGQLTDITKKNEIITPFFEDTNTLINFLEKEYKGLKNAEYTLAVNKNIVKENKVLHQNDEIALLPPFSGG